MCWCLLTRFCCENVYTCSHCSFWVERMCCQISWHEVFRSNTSCVYHATSTQIIACTTCSIFAHECLPIAILIGPITCFSSLSDLAYPFLENLVSTGTFFLWVVEIGLFKPYSGDFFSYRESLTFVSARMFHYYRVWCSHVRVCMRLAASLLCFPISVHQHNSQLLVTKSNDTQYSHQLADHEGWRERCRVHFVRFLCCLRACFVISSICAISDHAL